MRHGVFSFDTLKVSIAIVEIEVLGILFLFVALISSQIGIYTVYRWLGLILVFMACPVCLCVFVRERLPPLAPHKTTNTNTNTHTNTNKHTQTHTNTSTHPHKHTHIHTPTHTHTHAHTVPRRTQLKCLGYLTPGESFVNCHGKKDCQYLSEGPYILKAIVKNNTTSISMRIDKVQVKKYQFK
ncbi:unnamed protein product [Arctogadus glacialis]